MITNKEKLRSMLHVAKRILRILGIVAIFATIWSTYDSYQKGVENKQLVIKIDNLSADNKKLLSDMENLQFKYEESIGQRQSILIKLKEMEKGSLQSINELKYSINKLIEKNERELIEEIKVYRQKYAPGKVITYPANEMIKVK